MKVTELQIGDWYIWEAEGKKYPMQVTKETFGLLDEDIANFEPISLNSEILEKNGFEKVNESVFRIYNYSANLHIGINFDKFKNNMPIIYLFDSNTDSWPGYHQYDLLDCQYVHKFQHILKDLEIEKEIVL